MHTSSICSHLKHTFQWVCIAHCCFNKMEWSGKDVSVWVVGGCVTATCVIMLNMTLKLLTSQHPTRLKRRDRFWYPSEDEQSRATRDNICKSEPSLVKHLTLLKDLDSFFGNLTHASRLKCEDNPWMMKVGCSKIVSFHPKILLFLLILEWCMAWRCYSWR